MSSKLCYFKLKGEMHMNLLDTLLDLKTSLYMHLANLARYTRVMFIEKR